VERVLVRITVRLSSRLTSQAGHHLRGRPQITLRAEGAERSHGFDVELGAEQNSLTLAPMTINTFVYIR